MDAVALVDVPDDLMRDDLDRRAPTSSRFEDHTGKAYHGVTVVGFAGYLKEYSTWLVECRCGKQFLCRANFFKHRSAGCGCRNLLHGGCGTVEYSTWKGMVDRCNNEKHPSYAYYGGRGIKVCRRWRESFAHFLEDVGNRPTERHSLDRINNDGDYCPDNCRWATAKQQVWNSRSVRMITHKGIAQPMSAWAGDLGITRERMRQRVNACLDAGVDVSEAVTTPVGEVMPSFKNNHMLGLVSYWILRRTRRRNVVKEEWFNGEVHVAVRGDDWPENISTNCFKKIVQAESSARQGKVKCRSLDDHVMFKFVSEAASKVDAA